MYCPNCGAESTFGLKYCKRCGGSLTELTDTAVHTGPPNRPTWAAWPIALATAVICLGGLGIVFTNAYDLVRPLPPGGSPGGNTTAIAIVMIVFGSAVVFGILAMLIK